MRLTTYERWDEFLYPWRRFTIGIQIARCKKTCMKSDKKGFWGYKYEESFEPWKSRGYPVDDKPVFPCSKCLVLFKSIRPKWKRIVNPMKKWLEEHKDSDF